MTGRNYKVNWHHRLIADTLEQVEQGKLKRLMIFMPPRHGKSQLASINFPAWYLGKHPDKKIICASYSAELAQDFGGKTRDLVNEPVYRATFPLELREDSQSKAKWDTKEGGYYVSVGVGGAITGRGADCVAAGTRVWTEGGEREVEKVLRSDLILSYNPKSKKL